jgi:hypothetical protein
VPPFFGVLPRLQEFAHRQHTDCQGIDQVLEPSDHAGVRTRASSGEPREEADEDVTRAAAEADAATGSDGDMLPPDIPCVGLFSLPQQEMEDILASVSTAFEPPAVGACTEGEEDIGEERI